METIHKAVSFLQAAHTHTEGCSCLKAWAKFQASGQFTNYIKKIQSGLDAEMQQGKFNDVNEVGTSAIKHFKAAHKQITHPHAFAAWQKDQGITTLKK